jgi:hypothetical protein
LKQSNTYQGQRAIHTARGKRGKRQLAPQHTGTQPKSWAAYNPHPSRSSQSYSITDNQGSQCCQQQRHTGKPIA